MFIISGIRVSSIRHAFTRTKGGRVSEAEEQRARSKGAPKTKTKTQGGTRSAGSAQDRNDRKKRRKVRSSPPNHLNQSRDTPY
jgi:hypothetical protein